jgi:uncharacterized caspase-like protein
MSRITGLLVGLLSVLMSIPFPALAEKRIALVIGNGAYVKVPRLPNPTNDSASMAGLLRKAGFDIVEERIDLRADAMRRVLRDFSEQVRDADVAVVFYAGHGMELNGVNYLIPVDATLARDVDVEDEAVSLDRVIRTIEPARRLQLVILDACRDNPFLRSMRRTVISRSVRSGHGDIDEKSLPPNTLIAYAQKAGATAEDGTSSNSPYTTALLKHLPTPGLDVELALRRVRDEVLKATSNRQEPFKYGSLGGTELPLVPAATGPLAPIAPQPLSMAEREWQQYAKDTKDIRLLEAFKEKHKADPVYVRLAEARIEELKKQTASAARPSEPAKPGLPGPQTSLPAPTSPITITPSPPPTYAPKRPGVPGGHRIGEPLVPTPVEERVYSRTELQRIAIWEFGLRVIPGSGDNREGVVVSEVDSASDAALKGIKPGDIILEVYAYTVKSPKDMSIAINRATSGGVEM